MKSLIFFITMMMVLSSCRTNLLNSQQGESSLKGVYDQNYSLNIARAPEKYGLYQFEVCLTSSYLQQANSTLRPENSCVAALKDGDENVTFYIDTLPIEELALTDDEQSNLIKMQRQWGEYKDKQGFLAKSQLAGKTAGAAVVIGSTAHVAGIYDASRRTTQLATKQRQQMWDQYLQNDTKKNKNWYKRLIENKTNKQSTVEEMLRLESKLNAYGYSTTSAVEKTIAVNKLDSIEHIFSNDFIDHMKSAEITKYIRNHNIKDNILDILKEPFKYSDDVTGASMADSSKNVLSFDEIIQKFLKDKTGRTITDIINPNYLDRFIKYKALLDYYGRNYDKFNQKKTKSGALLSELDNYYRHSKNADRLLFQINSFTANKGVPPQVLDDISKNKVLLQELIASFPDSALDNKTLKFSDVLDKFKQSETYMNPAKKLKKESAKKISNILRKSLTAVIIGAVATVAVLKYSKQDLREAKHAVENTQLQFKNLNVLLSDSSPLLSTDPSNNEEVPSVKDVLSYITIAWGGANFDNNVTHYCYPKLTQNGTIESDCQDQQYFIR